MVIVTPRCPGSSPSSRINYKRTSALSHSNATLSSSQVLLLRRPLPYPSVDFCISIASTAHTVLARAGLRNLCNAKILLGIAGQLGFWGASWRDCSLPECLRPLLLGGRTNVYVLDFLVAERLRPLLPGGRTCVPQVNIKIVSTTSRRPSALQRLSSAISNSPDRHNVQSWKRRTRCLRHWSRLRVHSKPILVYYFVHVY